MFRVQVQWTSVGLGRSYTNLHFDDGGSAAIAHDTVADWLSAIAPRLAPTVTAVVQPEVRTVTIATGETTDITAIAPVTQAGTGAGDRVPDVAQVLYRLTTGGILAGRRVKGRINVPGLTEEGIVQGGITASVQAQFQSAIDSTLLDAARASTLVVYSRPRYLDDVVIRPGFAFEVQSASVWGELAVLRSRRS